MQVVETFGRTVEAWSNQNPQRARTLLRTGWEAQNLKNRFSPDKRLQPADRKLARIMMDAMLAPLQDPEHSAMVSVFTPCEMLQEVGLNPYNVEAFSCYLSGSQAERGFLQQAENTGISETLCSYHKTFLGAAQKGVLPKPKCIVYTNLTCDANLLTFRTLSQLYHVQPFAIDVPMQQNEDNVEYVAAQLPGCQHTVSLRAGQRPAQAEVDHVVSLVHPGAEVLHILLHVDGRRPGQGFSVVIGLEDLRHVNVHVVLVILSLQNDVEGIVLHIVPGFEFLPQVTGAVRAENHFALCHRVNILSLFLWKTLPTTSPDYAWAGVGWAEAPA